MRNTVLKTTLGMALGASLLATPAQAVDLSGTAQPAPVSVAETTWQHYDDDDRWERRRYRDRYYGREDRRRYDEPVYRDTRVWRGRDGRTYCRRSDGTTGLIVGGALGAIVGREIDSRGDRTLGTILGAAGGAILGREVERGRSRCR